MDSRHPSSICDDFSTLLRHTISRRRFPALDGLRRFRSYQLAPWQFERKWQPKLWRSQLQRVSYLVKPCHTLCLFVFTLHNFILFYRPFIFLCFVKTLFYRADTGRTRVDLKRSLAKTHQTAKNVLPCDILCLFVFVLICLRISQGKSYWLFICYLYRLLFFFNSFYGLCIF